MPMKKGSSRKTISANIKYGVTKDKGIPKPSMLKEVNEFGLL